MAVTVGTSPPTGPQKEDFRTTFDCLASTDPSYTGTLTGGTGVVNLGSGQFVKDASGNLGIGTASPTSRLTVGLGSYSAAAVNTTGMYTVSGGGLVVLSDGVNFASRTGSDRMALDTAGNLGLGVTPSAWGGSTALQIGSWGALASSNAFGTSIGFNNFYNGTNSIYSFSNNAARLDIGAGTFKFFTAPSGTAGNPISFTQAMTLGADNRLLVGTGSNQVVMNGRAVEFYNTGAGDGEIRAADDSSSWPAIAVNKTTVKFSTNNTERGQFDASGNLLVGRPTQLSSERFAVQGASAWTASFENTRNTSGDLCHYWTMGGNTNNSSSHYLQCVTAGVGAQLQILGNGNVQNTNNSYGAISDLKLKEDITDASPKLDDLMQVRVVNYRFKADPTHKQIGVIAQELEQVFPGLVEETPDRDTEGTDLGTTTKSVKYSVFVPMLIKAMQEQQAQIEALTARLTALETN